MKNRLFSLLFLSICLCGMPVFSQSETGGDTDLLGLPGDNLDLYAVLNLFQKSKTIEEFENALNDEKVGVNNLDLNVDEKVDFIKVETKQNGDDFTFVLQVDVLEEETQDVAVILVSKDEKEKVTIQAVGDEDLYGKDYVIEPKLEKPSVTANPAYSGPDTVTVTNQAATVVVVESEPIVQYVYSPMYVPYYPPYYYGYYPVYYRPYPVISISFYSRNHRHHHHHYHGGRGGNTVIINNNNYNNYSRTRNTSNTVKRNASEGNYRRDKTSNRPSTSPKTNKTKEGVNKKGNVKNNKAATPSKNTKTKSSKPQKKSTPKAPSKPKSKPKRKGKK